MSEIVDDRDPRVKYTGVWFLVGTEEEYNSTTSVTYTAGARAMFIFRGTSIQVFGTTSYDNTSLVDPPLSTYVLDGLLVGVFNPALQAKNTTIYRRLFFQSPVLVNEQHNLTITSQVPGAALWLDYFVITSNEVPVLSSPLPSTSSQPGNTPSASTELFTSLSSLIPTATPATHAKANVSVGSIVGSTIGTVSFTVVIAFILLYQCGRRKHQNQSSRFYQADSNSLRRLRLSPFVDWGRINSNSSVVPNQVGPSEETSGIGPLHAPHDVTSLPHYQSVDEDPPQYASRASL